MVAIRQPWQVKRIKGAKLEQIALKHETVWAGTMEEEEEYNNQDKTMMTKVDNSIIYLFWHRLSPQQIAAKGHSEQDLQPKYAKNWLGASRVAQFSSKGPQQLVKNGFLGHRLSGCTYILVKGVK